MVLRRRTDGIAVPRFDHAKTPIRRRGRMSQKEFASKYGASPQDIRKVVEFARKSRLTVVEKSAASRSVVLSGTVAKMSKAFKVELNRYRRAAADRRGKGSRPEIFRGRKGYVQVPKDISKAIIGVFGLDNRRIGAPAPAPEFEPPQGSGDPPVVGELLLQTVLGLYNFPPPGPRMSEQTIGIFNGDGSNTPQGGGFYQLDLDAYFGPLGYNFYPYPCAITVLDNYGNNGPQPGGGGTTADICVSAAATIPTTPSAKLPGGGLPDYPGAKIAVYFSDRTQAGWVGFFQQALSGSGLPPGVKPPTVLLVTPILTVADDAYPGLANYNAFEETVVANYVDVTSDTFDAIDSYLQDAAVKNVTVCATSWDCGCFPNSGPPPFSDTYAHVAFPASDPWVLAVGGTTIGQPADGEGNLEYPWNDYCNFDPSDPTDSTGATGGGVSAYYPLPAYQVGVGVPRSINPAPRPGPPRPVPHPAGSSPPGVAVFSPVGRGVPDVAANASGNSAYSGLTIGARSANPSPLPISGHHAATSLWAGLIAVINSNLLYDVGFVNPFLYSAGLNKLPTFNPISDPLNQSNSALPGCPANNNWVGSPVTSAQQAKTQQVTSQLGYSTGPLKVGLGWNACTGWGSPNGVELLKALNDGTAPDCYFIMKMTSFDEQTVVDLMKPMVERRWPVFFDIVAEGFTVDDLGLGSNEKRVQPALTIPQYMELGSSGAQLCTSCSPGTPQRFLFEYKVHFISVPPFPPFGPLTNTISAKITSAINPNKVVSSSAVFELFRTVP